MKYEKIQVSKKEKSLVEIIGEIPATQLSEYKTTALKNISETTVIDGFRKGHIPEKVLIDKFGEMYIWEEAAELALKDITPELVEREAPEYVGRPKISIQKLAPGNPLMFSITVATRPNVKLPDYKKIGADEMKRPLETVNVTEKEVNDVIEQVRNDYAHREFHIKNKDSHSHDHAPEDMEKLKPEITDEFVKTLGDFTSVADLKEKIKENLTKEKNHRLIEKRRGKILDALVAATPVDVPDILVDYELDKMFSQFENEISNLGLKIEDYLKHIKKTPEDLRKEWLPESKKRAALNLILEDIAKKENIVPDEKLVKDEVDHLTSHSKDVDSVRATAYVNHALTIEKVIMFLEKQ